MNGYIVLINIALMATMILILIVVNLDSYCFFLQKLIMTSIAAILGGVVVCSMILWGKNTFTAEREYQDYRDMRNYVWATETTDNCYTETYRKLANEFVDKVNADKEKHGAFSKYYYIPSDIAKI